MIRCIALALLCAAPAPAALSEAELARAVARPPADARLPAALRFVDAQGRIAALGEVANGKPLVLIFADFTCRHVCGPGLILTATALKASGLVAERDYRVAVIGIDPADGARDAAAMHARLAFLPGIAEATRVLRATPATIAAATHALGYGYVRDAESDQYAHDASVYVFAADGRLAALLPELALRPEALRAALRGTAPPRPREGLAQQAARLCYGLAAAHGRFGRPIVIGLQIASAALLAGAAMLFLRRRTVA